MERMSHLEYVQSVRSRIAGIAENVLAGEACVLQASHTLVGLLWEAELVESDDAFKTLRLVSSEIDHLPLGSVREHWAPEALAEIQPEIESTREWATPLVADACNALLLQFKA